MTELRRKAAFRVYFVHHGNGRVSGMLMRRWTWFMDLGPPAAYGENEDDVLAQLEAEMQERIVRETDEVARYLWREVFSTRTVTLEVPTATLVKKRAVIGDRVLPLKLTFAWCENDGGSFRIALPRFDWWLMVESLEGAPRALAHAVTGSLLGSQPAGLYDFRHEGKEHVVEWEPAIIAKPPAAQDERVALPTLDAVSDNWVAKPPLDKPIATQSVDWRSELRLDAWRTHTPRSVLLVGPPSVGKTAQVNQLARYLRVQKRIDEDHPGLRSTTADRLLAGMVYLGMWQERIFALVSELQTVGDILYVDRLSSLLRSQGDGASIGDLLYEPMRAENTSLIAECTQSELIQARRKNPAFVDLFSVCEVEEPPRAELAQLLQTYADRTGREYHPHAIRRLVQLLGTYRRDQAFPGKGFAFLRAAENDSAIPKVVMPDDIENAFARSSGLPSELVQDRQATTVEDVASRLSTGVIGQDTACDAVARAIVPFKAGLNPPDRPIGVFLFVGPTGVGKTELAKQTARYFFGDAKRLVRVDMSEYAAPGSGARLLSAGRGLRSLATEVRRQPLSVVLLDEIEKAHASVFDVLLAMLGEGRLTDSHGELVDFRMTILVMTSNLGVRVGEAVGFAAQGDSAADFRRAVRDHFRPELLGRVDRVVPFSSLDQDNIRQIVELEIARIVQREGIKKRGIEVQISTAAKDELARLGTDRAFGARPLRRVLEQELVTPLAVWLADNPKERRRVVSFGTKNEASSDFHIGSV